jgi:hypothetical protein
MVAPPNGRLPKWRHAYRTSAGARRGTQYAGSPEDHQRHLPPGHGRRRRTAGCMPGRRHCPDRPGPGRSSAHDGVPVARRRRPRRPRLGRPYLRRCPRRTASNLTSPLTARTRSGAPRQGPRFCSQGDPEALPTVRAACAPGEAWARRLRAARRPLTRCIAKVSAPLHTSARARPQRASAPLRRGRSLGSQRGSDGRA